MELLQFGFRPQVTTQAGGNARPVLLIRADNIKILWSSWCDVLVAHQNGTAPWTIEYMGTGLTSSQSESTVSSQQVKDSIDGIRAFGGVMHEGLLGYILPQNDCLNIANQVIVFATDLEIEAGVPQIQSYTLDNDHRIFDIKVASAGRVLVSVMNRVTGEPSILSFQGLLELRSFMSKALFFSIRPSLGSLVPIQWCTNATTSTILDQYGRVYTSTCDSRYPKCLGRSYEGTLAFEAIPYLSETHVSNIASGGYMSAALGSDGSFFVWGQSSPGTSNELNVLENTLADYKTEFRETGIWAEDEQDDFIKCLTIHIDGEEARAYNLAVGHGHVMVAAEVVGSGDNRKRAVFSAGDNGKHQTGLESGKGYVPEFTELRAHRREHIQQLVAAGWSSLMLRRDDKPEIEHRHSSASGIMRKGSL